MLTPFRTIRAALEFALVWAVSASSVYAQNDPGSGGIQSPLNPAFSTIPGFIAGALKVLVQVSLPIISLFIVYSGFLFVFARGNTEKLSQARTNFLYVIIGALLILGAWLIASLLSSTVTQLTG